MPTFLLLEALKKCDYGCHFGRCYVGCRPTAYIQIILYCCQPLSQVTLQRMLHVCYNVGSQLDIIFNAEKSYLCKVGKCFNVHTDGLVLGQQVYSLPARNC